MKLFCHHFSERNAKQGEIENVKWVCVLSTFSPKYKDEKRNLQVTVWREKNRNIAC